MSTTAGIVPWGRSVNRLRCSPSAVQLRTQLNRKGKLSALEPLDALISCEPFDFDIPPRGGLAKWVVYVNDQAAFYVHRKLHAHQFGKGAKCKSQIKGSLSCTPVSPVTMRRKVCQCQ